MGGCTKTSTLDVTIRGQQYAYSKLKKVTALAGIQLLSGHLMVSLLVTVMRCCSTCLAAVTSQPNKQEKRYTALVFVDLVLLEVMEMS